MDSDRQDQWKPASKPRTSFIGEVHVAAAVAAMLAVMTLGAGLLTEGGLRVLFFALSALAAVYALYVLVVLAGWHRVERVIDRALGATAEGQHQLQVRVPIAPGTDPAFRDSLFDALNRRLGGHGSCERIEQQAAELRYFIQGADEDRLVEACRTVVTTSPVPAGAYLWRLRDGRRGERLDL